MNKSGVKLVRSLSVNHSGRMPQVNATAGPQRTLAHTHDAAAEAAASALIH